MKVVLTSFNTYFVTEAIFKVINNKKILDRPSIF